jgi:hypothetical protein
MGVKGMCATEDPKNSVFPGVCVPAFISRVGCIVRPGPPCASGDESVAEGAVAQPASPIAKMMQTNFNTFIGNYFSIDAA